MRHGSTYVISVDSVVEFQSLQFSQCQQVSETVAQIVAGFSEVSDGEFTEDPGDVEI